MINLVKDLWLGVVSAPLYFVLGGASFLVTFLVTPFLKKASHFFDLLDHPNDRKSHDIPMPKLGGMALFLGVWVPVLIFLPFTDELFAILVGSCLVVMGG